MKKLNAMFVSAFVSLAATLVACGNVDTSGTASSPATCMLGAACSSEGQACTTSDGADAVCKCGYVATPAQANSLTCGDSGVNDTGTDTGTDAGNACSLGATCSTEGQTCASDTNVVCKCGYWSTAAQAAGLTCADSGAPDTGTDTGTDAGNTCAPYSNCSPNGSTCVSATGATLTCSSCGLLPPGVTCNVQPDSGTDTSSSLVTAQIVLSSPKANSMVCRAVVLGNGFSDPNQYYTNCVDDTCLSWGSQTDFVLQNSTCQSTTGGTMTCVMQYPSNTVLDWSCNVHYPSTVVGEDIQAWTCDKSTAFPQAGESLTFSLNGVVVHPIHLKTNVAKTWSDSYGCISVPVPSGRGTFAPN